MALLGLCLVVAICTSRASNRLFGDEKLMKKRHEEWMAQHGLAYEDMVGSTWAICDFQGCQGGLMEDAFKFIQHNGGLTTEANYPYQGEDETCNSQKASSKAATLTGYEQVPENDEKALLRTVAKQPVSGSIDASGYGFQFYSSGVFDGSCGTNLDHGVTADGYGSSSDGTKYWIVKNSTTRIMAFTYEYYTYTYIFVGEYMFTYI